jgi:hypothetical protein
MERNNYCANCKSYMRHATGETCSAYCRDQLEVRRAETIRAQPRTTLEQLERAERYFNAGSVTIVDNDEPPINVRAWRWAAVIFSAGAWLALLVLAIIIWGPK